MKFLFGFLIFLTTFIHAQTCDDCAPLAEVSITNHGLEKLISLSLDENLKNLEKVISERAGFRQLVLDRSHCKTQTISEAYKNKSPDNCYGLPDLSDVDGIGASTQLRPFRAEINNWKLNKVDLSLSKPVQCKNFVCDFEVKANEISVSGDLDVKYTDKNETFIPPTKITVRTTENPNLKMSGQVLVDPRTGKLNDLVFLKDETTRIDVAPGSLTVDMDIKHQFTSEQDEIRLRAKNFHRYISVNKITPEFIEKQYQSARFHLAIDAEKEIQSKRKSEGKPELPWQKAREQAEKEVDQMIAAKYGSVEKFKQKLRSIKWPSPGNDQETYEFIKNPPPELVIFRDISDKMQLADVAALGENNGYTNPNAFILTLVAVRTAQQAAQSSFMTENLLQPMIEKEVLSVVKAEVNAELRNLREYWNQISKIPNLNLQNIQILKDLESKLSNAKTENEKENLRNKIEAHKKKMDSDWISIDTEVEIDKNMRDGKLLKAQISKSNPACNDYPKKFSDDSDTNFDIRTEFGVNTLQDFFDRMAKNKNLDVCVESTDPLTCKDGKKLTLNKPPKISCDNGDFSFEFDAEAATKILGLDIGADVAAKIKAQVQNCSGSPCIQFTDSKGNFKNIFLNTFFGGMLDRGISSALAKTKNLPVEIPHAKLTKSNTSKKDCNTKLDWDLQK